MTEALDGAPAMTNALDGAPAPGPARRRTRGNRRRRRARQDRERGLEREQDRERSPGPEPDEAWQRHVAVLREGLAACDAYDRARLTPRIRAVERAVVSAKALERLRAEIESGAARRSLRARPLDPIGASALDPLAIAATLPIAAAEAAIAEAMRDNAVIIVCGATGSGKTTQLPKMCLRLGRGVDGLIGHTQPRRIAARSVAARIADELGPQNESAVGFKVRFDARIDDACRVKLMTDGILLAEMQRDRDLLGYDTLIIDEAHERSLNVDIVLGYLKRLVVRRPELRVVISSATIDTGRFAEFFDDAPVIEVGGRRYPVEVRYRPPAGGDGSESDEPAVAVTEAVVELWRGGPKAATDPTGEVGRDAAAGDARDILVFLATERDIHDTARELNRAGLPGIEVLPLYARLPLARQQRVFKPGRGRRVILATNVAETSLTVPRIGFVIDAGTARISRHSHRHAVRRLPVEPVSRASAMQRLGRAGRLAPGVCLRLYSQEDFESRPEFAEPEIARSDLTAVLLQLAALGLGAGDDFPFLDAPDRRYVNDGYRLLQELGAMNDAFALTPVGRQLARLPVDPRIGRMLLAAREQHCMREMLIIASGLSVPDPRAGAQRVKESDRAARGERQEGDRQEQGVARQAYRDERSDFMTLIGLWDRVIEQRKTLKRSLFERWCERSGLLMGRLREWREVHDQLRSLVREQGLLRADRDAGASNEQVNKGRAGGPRAGGDGSRPGARYGAVHRALLTGLLRNVGFREDKREYLGPRDVRFQLSGASVLAESPPKWAVAAELVETSRTYAHLAGRVRPEWVERAAGDLLHRGYFDAHWDEHRAEAMVYERTSLYGITITARRRVRFSPVSRSDARELFIRAALVEGQWRSRVPVLARNRATAAMLRQLDHKLRRPDVVVRDEDVYRFYEARLPEDVVDGATFEASARRMEREQPGWLELDAEAIRHAREPDDVALNFPDAVTLDDLEPPLAVSLKYAHAPGESIDGVTASIPVARLKEIEPERFEWLVPGMLAEKVTALLRALPKSIRRELMPLPDVAEAFARSALCGQDGRPLAPQADGGQVRHLAPQADRGQVSGLAPQADRGQVRPLVNSYPTEGLRASLRRYLRSERGVQIPAAVWPATSSPGELPAHLSLRFKVLDEHGTTLAKGRDLAKLQAALNAGRPAARSSPVEASERLVTRSGRRVRAKGAQAGSQVRASGRPRERAWRFGGLPHSRFFDGPGGQVERFPALADCGDGVALQWCATPSDAHGVHREGLRRLLSFACPQIEQAAFVELSEREGANRSLSLIYALLPAPPEATVSTGREDHASSGSADRLPELAEAFELALCDRLIGTHEAPELAAVTADGRAGFVSADRHAALSVIDGRQFDALCAHAATQAMRVVEALGELVGDVLTRYHRIAITLGESDAPAHAGSVADARDQLNHLVHREFLLSTGHEALEQLPRYLEALELRLDKLARGGARDTAKLAEVAPLWARYVARARAHAARGRRDPELARYRWMMEEFRVSVFAQELGTAYPISRKRLDEQWAQVGS